jgi:aminoglycoside 2''-phosphotransferase
MAWQKPAVDDIRATLQRHAPNLAREPIEFLAEGWEFWAFEAGGYVLRFPKDEASVRSLALDRALMPELREYLTVPVPRLDVWGDEGPNGVPFAGHPKLPGRPVWPNGDRASQALIELAPRLSTDFGRQFGRLLRELHAFPAERALACGIASRDAVGLRSKRVQEYEQVIRRVFPLLSCETRTFVQATYEQAINDPAYYNFEPSFAHGDLDVNALVDEDGNLSGLIDFGQSFVGSSAVDYWLPVYGFPRLGIPDQTRPCLDAAGITATEQERMRPELAFVDFRYPVLDILYGLETDDQGYVKGGILDLNAMAPADVECP